MLLQDTRIAPEQLRIRKIAKKNFGSPIVNQYHQCLTMNRRLTSLRHGTSTAADLKEYSRFIRRLLRHRNSLTGNG
ncbi:hypothetical protein QLX08_005613 [Tetragonisca angustula]|uniref:Uncharacterized protein n=1 Tax=Tetragonisca angustula TaxID=166442 RepID=A0AAW0ZXZ6_9HYME